MTIGTAITIALVALLIIFGILWFVGSRMQKRQELQQTQIEATAQQVSMFIIDKKMIKLKDAGLPQHVTDQVNWFIKRQKVPVLRAKVGPQVMNLICDNAIFESVPVKKEVKATISGIYVTSVKGMHGKQQATTGKKKNFLQRLSDKIQEKGGAAPVR